MNLADMNITYANIKSPDIQVVEDNGKNASVKKKKMVSSDIFHVVRHTEDAKFVAEAQVRQTVLEAVESATKRIEELLDPTAGMSEEKKTQFENRIMAKIQSGKELTEEELRYLRIHYPELYMQVMRVQTQRKALKERLKHCHSKEEASRVFNDAMSHIGEHDPAKQMLVAAYQDVYKEFTQDEDYNQLPNTEEQAKKSGNKKTVRFLSKPNAQKNKNEID